MDIPVALNVSVRKTVPCDPNALLRWVNERLRTGFTHIEQLATGAAFCQLMHILFPSLKALSSVKLDCGEDQDWADNYNLLQKVFAEVGLLKFIPVNELIKRNKEELLTFLQWFRAFFEKNQGRRCYDTASGAQPPDTATVGYNTHKNSPPTPVDLDVDIKRPLIDDILINEDETQEVTKKAEPSLDQGVPLKHMNGPENQESPQVLPAEEADQRGAESPRTNHVKLPSANENVSDGNPSFLTALLSTQSSNPDNTYLNACQKLVENISAPPADKTVSEKLIVADHHRQRPCANPQIAQISNPECDAITNANVLPSSNFTQVIPQPLYLFPAAPAPPQVGMSPVNGSDVILISDSEDKPQEAEAVTENGRQNPSTETTTTTTTATQKAPKPHSQTLQEVCSQTPYCLYADMGRELDNTTCAVLIGYFDCHSGVSVVRRLNTLRINQPRKKDQTKPTITKHTANAAANLLVDLLKTAKLPLDNLKVFYCNIPDPEVNRRIGAKLRERCPHLVSLGGLACMVGDACQTGLMEYYSQVVELINDVHFFTLPDCLKDADYDVKLPIRSQFVTIITVIQNLSSNWVKVEDYFKNLRPDAEYSRLQRIRSQMGEPKVRLDFIFLSQALGTFRSFQDQQRSMERDMVVELQTTALLVNFCASSIFTPSATDEFVRKRDVEMLRRAKDLLPIESINVGLRAGRYLGSLSVAVLGQEDRSNFLLTVQRFYQTMLQILIESLPGKLSPLSMRNIGTLLKHPTSLKCQKVPDEQLGELSSQLGVCTNSTSQLTSEYANYIRKTKDWHGFEAETPGLRWLKVLDSLGPSPVLFKLVLTLLAFPRSLQLKHIFQSSDRLTSPQNPAHRKGVKRRYRMLRAEREQSSSSDEDHRRPPAVKRGQRREKESEVSDYTDNSSDLVDVTEDYRLTARQNENKTHEAPKIQKPVGEIQKPVGEIQKPVGEIQKPAGEIQKPAGEIQLPVGEIQMPAGEIQKPVGEIQKPAGEIQMPAGEIQMPVGEIQMPAGEIQMPGSEILMPVIESVYILEGDEDKRKHKAPKAKPANPKPEQRQQGKLVLIQLEDSFCWPAVTVPGFKDNLEPDMKSVVWYGHGMTSEVCIEYLRPFSDFAKFFSQNTFATVATYKDAVFLALREASARCRKQFSASFDDKAEILGEMLDWAFDGFKPMGPKGFAPAVLEGKQSAQASNPSNGKITSENLPRLSVMLYKLPMKPPEKTTGADSAEKGAKKKSRASWKGRSLKKKSPLFGEAFEDTDMSPDFVPYKKRPYVKVDQSNKGNAQNVYTQPDQKQRERIIRRILELDLDIDDFCLCCGTEGVEIFHPLFKGSLCSECKNNFTETLHRYDEDGYQSYCTICCYGMEVILCGNESCCRSFCADCLNILVGEGTFLFLKDLDPWICYMCRPHETHGALTPRPDWSIRVQELFANNSAMAFEPHRVYPSIPASLRRPVRVLSLFDGIATGYLVLKDLGFKVEKYVASEVCDDSLAVAHVNHDGKIVHVGDARLITQEHLDQWGPFDLLIGGSPCNDLSIVNPLRKGLYEGTGRLFFEYYRILQLLKPKEEDPRPFFWLFENVVFMNVHDRLNICRFLECNPVLVDAVKVSPANRARYFWGNIPGMSRPITASQTDKLNLQDCLEIGRVATMAKVRTITTNANSLKQGKNVSMLPVLQNGTEDTLWITEIEKIFGFPKHYTDVRNMNRQQRQKVLGKAWSVPVIRHLFAPLKDYFACEELPPMAASSASTSGSSPCPPSPATPEILQLR